MIVDTPGMILGLLLIVGVVGLVVYYYMKRRAGDGANRKSGRVFARDEIEAAVKDKLAHATKAAAGRNPGSDAHIPILVDNRIVGRLWQDADLAKVKIGSHWAGPGGEHVQLVKGDQVVGMIRVNV